MAILGIDEVGRGPVAGPLVVGAVILPEPWPEWASELKDSKKLSVKRRESLNDLIVSEALAVGLGWVPAREIDEVGISEALRLATRRAVKEVQGKKVLFSQIIIDGKVNFLNGTALSEYVSTVIKADNLVKEVSAASIVAKVARDHYMYEVGLKFPDYGFERNVGYGTVVHLKAIRELGICEEHRRSFEPIRSMAGFNSDDKTVVKNTTIIGARGEDAVCEYLKKRGHKIVERNFKTKFCEIDIISLYEDKLYFTEVKYRKDDLRGGGLAAIDNKKLTKMKFAVEVFLKFRNEFINCNPLLAVADVGGDFKINSWFVL